MTLILFRPYDSEYSWDYGVVKKDYLIHFSLFLVCAHIWMGIFIKQLKFGFLRQNAVLLVLGSGAVLALIMELFRYSLSFAETFSFMSFFVDILGVLAGIGIFRLVYRSCY
jgi:hypothetical protein